MEGLAVNSTPGGGGGGGTGTLCDAPGAMQTEELEEASPVGLVGQGDWWTPSACHGLEGACHSQGLGHGKP